MTASTADPAAPGWPVNGETWAAGVATGVLAGAAAGGDGVGRCEVHTTTPRTTATARAITTATAVVDSVLRRSPATATSFAARSAHL